MLKILVSIKFYVDVLEIYNFIMSFVTFHPFHWITDKQIEVLGKYFERFVTTPSFMGQIPSLPRVWLQV